MANKKVKTLTVDGVTYDIKDDNAVHKTGNETETITGSKTFTYDTRFTKDKPQIIMKDTNASADVKNQSLTKQHNGPLIHFLDKNGKDSGYIYTAYGTNGEVSLVLQANRLKSDNTEASASLSVILDKNGDAHTFAVKPGTSTSTSATNIATVGWANTGGVDSNGNNVNNIVHKTSDERISGRKIFTGNIDFDSAYTGGTGFIYQQAAGQLVVGLRNDDNTEWSSNYIQLTPNAQTRINATTNVQLFGTTPATTNVHPAASSNNTSIATTKWVNDKLASSGWGMPDYSKGVSLSTGTTYTADKNGWVMWSCVNVQNGRLLIASRNFGEAAGMQNKWADCNSIIVPVSVGNTYRATGATDFYFYPCKVN